MSIAIRLHSAVLFATGSFVLRNHADAGLHGNENGGGLNPHFLIDSERTWLIYPPTSGLQGRWMAANFTFRAAGLKPGPEGTPAKAHPRWPFDDRQAG